MNLENLHRMYMRLSFTSKNRLRVYRKIATMVKYGIPLQRVLEMLYSQASSGGKKVNSPQAMIMKQAVNALKNGLPLSVAFRPFIPDNERMMIEAGEESHSLSDALENLITITVGMSKIKSMFIGGMVYPVILLSFLVGVLFLFSIKVFPAFDAVYPMEKWTGKAAGMANLTHFVNNYLVLTIVSFLVVFFIIGLSMPIWTGKIRKVFDNLPPWSIYRLISGAGFLMSLGALISSGVQTARALEKMVRSANPWFKERIAATLQNVYSGLNVGKALKKTGYNYPDKEIVEDLVVYSDLPSFAEMLQLIGTEWLSDTTEKVSKQTKILNTAALFLLFGVIAWMFTGLYDIVGQISDSVS